MTAAWTPEYLAASARWIGEFLSDVRDRITAQDPDAGPALDRTRGSAEEVARVAIDEMITAFYGTGLPVSIGDRLEVGYRGAMRLGTITCFDGEYPEWAWVEFPMKSGTCGEWAHTGLIGMPARRTDDVPRNPATAKITPAEVWEYLMERDVDRDSPREYQKAAWDIQAGEVWDELRGVSDDFTMAGHIIGKWLAEAVIDDVDDGEIAEETYRELADGIHAILEGLLADHPFAVKFNWKMNVVDPFGKVRKVLPLSAPLPTAQVEYTTQDAAYIHTHRPLVNIYRAAAVRYPEPPA
jgi:hypothetical protein